MRVFCILSGASGLIGSNSGDYSLSLCLDSNLGSSFVPLLGYSRGCKKVKFIPVLDTVVPAGVRDVGL